MKESIKTDIVLLGERELPWDLLLDADPEESLVRDYLERGECYVALHDGDVAGVMVLLRTRPRTMEIMNIAVKEPLRKRGIAGSMLEYADRKAREEGMTLLEIGTGNPGFDQMRLYQNCGFRITGVDLDFFRRNYPERIYENGLECRDMIRMEKKL